MEVNFVYYNVIQYFKYIVFVLSEKVKIKWNVDIHGNDIELEIKIGKTKHNTKLQKSPIVRGVGTV